MAVSQVRSSTRRVRAGVLALLGVFRRCSCSSNGERHGRDQVAGELVFAPDERRANTSYSSRNSNSRYSNNGTVSVAAAFKNSSTEATSCRVAVVLDTLSAPCCFVRDAFYDTLRNGNARSSIATVLPTPRRWKPRSRTIQTANSSRIRSGRFLEHALILGWSRR